MRNLKIYEQALEHYGASSQIVITYEELGELMVAISKYLRQPSEMTFHNMADEIADVEIMLAQLKTLLKAWDLVEDRRNFKLERLKSRLLMNKAQFGPIIINPDKTLEAIRNYCKRCNIPDSDATEIFNILQRI